MNIFDIIDGILTDLGVPFYNDMPEFEREPPALFISYSVYDRPAQFGDGDEVTTRYFVTVSIFARSHTSADETYDALKTFMKNGGFCRSGTAYISDNSFPKYHRITADYNIDL